MGERAGYVPPEAYQNLGQEVSKAAKIEMARRYADYCLKRLQEKGMDSNDSFWQETNALIAKLNGGEWNEDVARDVERITKHLEIAWMPGELEALEQGLPDPEDEYQKSRAVK